jgi:hypothetical protein
MTSKELIKVIRAHKGKVFMSIEHADMYIVIEKKDFINNLMREERKWICSVHANCMFVHIDRF